MVNAGLRDDVAALDVTGADGIGLFRTEFQFLVSATLPRRESQQRLYKCGARRGRRQAGHLPHRRRRRRQGLPYINVDDGGTRRIRRWAGGRCASRSTATG